VSVSGVFGRFSAEGVGPLNERPNKGNWARLEQRSDGKKSREGACRSMYWHHGGCTHGGNGSRSSSDDSFDLVPQMVASVTSQFCSQCKSFL